MRLVMWIRLFIIVMVCCLGVIPLAAGAQDIPVDVLELPPAAETEAGTESLPAGESVAQQELSSIHVLAWVCPDIHDEDDYYCGRDEDFVGRAIEFVLIGPDDSGEEFWFDVEIGTFPGDTVGVTYLYDVPLGTYEMCEAVPDGYEGFAMPVNDTQEAYDNCLAFEVGAEEVDVTFVNVPEDVDELPDTGAGLTAPSAPGTWVPVLLAGALLLTLAGSRIGGILSFAPRSSNR